MSPFQKRYFYWLGNIEGLSLLVLFFIAMPFRHFTGERDLVRHVGLLHGILFLMYVYTALDFALRYKWKKRNLFCVILFASLPFGFFYLNTKVKSLNTDR